MNTITLPLSIINQMLTHVQSCSEEEVCGLISERDDQIHSIYPIQNVSAQPKYLYQMDGKTQIDTMRNMRENNETLYGIYHSHPHSTAYPSATDIREAQYPDAIYFIISLDTEGVLDLRAYRLRNVNVEVLQVSVFDETNVLSPVFTVNK